MRVVFTNEVIKGTSDVLPAFKSFTDNLSTPNAFLVLRLPMILSTAELSTGLK